MGSAVSLSLCLLGKKKDVTVACGTVKTSFYSQVLTNVSVYELLVVVSGSSFLIVTHNSRQEKNPDFKRSPKISTGQSNKNVRFNSGSILNISFRPRSIAKASLQKK